MSLKDLNGNQRRQLIDTQQVFETWRMAHVEQRRRFLGSMRWAKRNDTEYLLRKVKTHETSLGPRSTATELAYNAFIRGRNDNAERLAKLSTRMDELAPINRAMGLGRLSVIAAQILRKCDDTGLLGEQLYVVGTNALFAYEVLAGAFIESELVTSGDIDLLYDARRSLSVAVNNNDVRNIGLIGILKEADKTFSLFRPRGYRAANNDGYMVDLIRPEPKDVFRDRSPSAITNLPEDMEGAPVFGLTWLINAPKIEATVLDEKGYPVRVVAIDPRVFALHKAWLSGRDDREPLKRRRDIDQAKAAAEIATRYLSLPFEPEPLSALPSALRDLIPVVSPPSSAKS
jgi:hypothetical protein